MPRCTAGHNDNTVCIQEYILMVKNAGKGHAEIRRVGGYAASDTVGECARLFENFLQHEMGEATLFQL